MPTLADEIATMRHEIEGLENELKGATKSREVAIRNQITAKTNLLAVLIQSSTSGTIG
jgi:hypothetical protein